MAILAHSDTRVIVQGMTGREGEFHTQQMLEYGTKVVAGVTPGKGGGTFLGLPVYNQVRQAVRQHGAEASVIFVPPPYAADAILESADAGIKLVVCITEGVPVHDMVKVHAILKEKGVSLIGPNCPGLATPGECKLGIIPGKILLKGEIGVVSRSGTLTYEVINCLTKAGLGQTTCIGIGGDPLIGLDFVEILKLFAADPQTRGVLLIGEIGGTDEEEAAQIIPSLSLPVVAFVAGKTAPPGKRMGHAGAIISGSSGTAEGKIKAFKEAGVPVADTVPQLVDLMKEALSHDLSGHHSRP